MYIKDQVLQYVIILIYPLIWYFLGSDFFLE